MTQEDGLFKSENSSEDYIEGLVKGQSKVLGDLSIVYGKCQVRKKKKVKHLKLDLISTYRPVELLHMDMMSPMQVESLTQKLYTCVVVDNYS